MNRPTASTINDDQLDALYAQLDRVRRLGATLATANAHDGSPSPLRPVGALIAVILGDDQIQETAA